MNTEKPRRLRDWLFNPFQFIAGGRALVIGLILIAATAAIASFSRVHLDGVLDMHLGVASIKRHFFFIEGAVDWLALSIVLILIGKLLSRGRGRIIDIVGTQALARWPMLISSLLGFLPGITATGAALFQSIGTSGVARPDPGMIAIFVLFTLTVVLMTVWMVALMYRGFAVSCNLKGVKAIAAFSAGLILAEVISKFALGALARLLLS